MLANRKAQAVVELAILGSLLIMAFSIALNYSEQYYRQLVNKQQCFRTTLAKAKAKNGAFAYELKTARRMPNLVSPMELGDIQQFSDSNTVLWSNKEVLPTVASGPVNTTKEYPFGFGAEPTAVTTYEKTERDGRISTRKSLVVTGDAIGNWSRERAME
jgi:hypothetical protein